MDAKKLSVIGSGSERLLSSASEADISLFETYNGQIAARVFKWASSPSEMTYLQESFKGYSEALVVSNPEHIFLELESPCTV